MTRIRISLFHYAKTASYDTLHNLKKGTSTEPVDYFLLEQPSDLHGLAVSASNVGPCHACLHVHSSSVTLEAITDSQACFVLSSGWNAKNGKMAEKIDLPPSTPAKRILLQLRSGDQFLTQAGRFLITYFEESLDDTILPSLSKGTVYNSQNESQQSRLSTSSTLEEVAARGIAVYPQDALLDLRALQEPTRAKYWLQGCFEEACNIHTSQERVIEAYEASFPDVEDFPSSEMFFKIFKDTFPSVNFELLDSSAGSFIVNGVRPRPKTITIRGLNDNPQGSSKAEISRAKGVAPIPQQTFDIDLADDTTLVENDTSSHREVSGSENAATVGLDLPHADAIQRPQITPEGSKLELNHSFNAMPELPELSDSMKLVLSTIPSMLANFETDSNDAKDLDRYPACNQCDERNMTCSKTTPSCNRCKLQNLTCCYPVLLSAGERSKTEIEREEPFGVKDIPDSEPGAALDAAHTDEENRTINRDDQIETTRRPLEERAANREAIISKHVESSETESDFENYGVPNHSMQNGMKPPEKSPVAASMRSASKSASKSRTSGSKSMLASSSQAQSKSPDALGILEELDGEGKHGPRSDKLVKDDLVHQDPTHDEEEEGAITPVATSPKPGSRKRKSSTRTKATGSTSVTKRRKTDVLDAHDSDNDGEKRGPNTKAQTKERPESSMLSEPRTLPEKRPDPTSTPSRSSRSSSMTMSAYDGPAPRMVISSNATTIEENKKAMHFFSRAGGTVVENVKDANFFCVGSRGLKKTAKFILAVALGRRIVTEKWLVDSATKGQFLDPWAYVPKDAAREQEWGFSLEEALRRDGQADERTGLLEGKEVYFTTGLKKELGQNYKEYREIALAIGASEAKPGLPRGLERSNDLWIIVGQQDDADAGKVSKLGKKLFSKDLLPLSVLRGVVDTESDEFAVNSTRVKLEDP